MDAVKTEVRRKAEAPPVNGALRRPLAPSEKNNAAPAAAGRRREVASRFMSGAVPPVLPAATASVARRCTSPSLSRTATNECTAPRRRALQPADRRRPSTPSTPSPPRLTPRSTTPVRDAAAAATEVHSASRCAIGSKAPEGSWASVQNPSLSILSESVASPAKKKEKLVPVSSLDQAKVQASAVTERKKSPLRRKNTGNPCENDQPSESPAMRTVEQHRWPAMMNGRGSAILASRSIAPADKATRSVSSSNPSIEHSARRRMPPSESTCNAPNQPLNKMAKRLPMHGGRRGDKAESGSDVSPQTSGSSKSTSRPSRTLSSHVPIMHRSSSLNKALSVTCSNSRAFQSPSRVRPSTPGRSQVASSSQSCTQPVVKYIVDARKGKKDAGQIENIHQLRLLYNRYLQWLFINAWSEDTLSFEKHSVEGILYGVWRSILKPRDAVTMRRIDVQQLQQELKLYNIIKELIAYLEKWPALEGENDSTLAGTIEALQASTLGLPVTSGAQADAVSVKNAISSAVDVMQTLSSSICYLLLKVEDRTSLISELSVVARQEKVTLDECRQVLPKVAELQVQESSLQTHLMQLRKGATGSIDISS